MRRPEEQIHRAVVQLLQVYQSRGLLTFCHVPNGERRDRATGGWQVRRRWVAWRRERLDRQELEQASCRPKARRWS